MAESVIKGNDMQGVSTTIIHAFSGTAGSSQEWTATENCFVRGYIYYAPSMGNYDANVKVDGNICGSIYVPNTSCATAVCVPVLKGQTVSVMSNDFSQIKCVRARHS